MNKESEQFIRQIVREELTSVSQPPPVQNVTIENNYDKEIAALESKIEEIKNLIPDEDISRNPSLNYTTRADYQGQEVRFTLFGQVLTPDEAAEYGNINYIEFGGEGGGGEDFAFKLYIVTLPTDPPQQRIAVVYGEVNKQPPQGMSSNPNSPYLIAPANNATVYLNISFNSDGQFQNSSISSGSSLPQNTGTNLYVSIGVVKFENNSYSVIRQTLLGDIIVRRQDFCYNGEPYFDFVFVGNLEPIENS